MSVTVPEQSTGESFDPDQPVALHPLVFLDEGDQVTVGRADIDSYAILPPDGAELVRRLAEGMTARAAGDWYERTYGEPVDVAELIAALSELELLRTDGGPAEQPAAPVRWQRLGQLVFSRPALASYALIVVGWLVAMLARPDLTPSYRQLFFTHSFSFIEVVLFLGQFPLMLVHEAAHALAGRRLGLRSRLRLGNRLYFLVLETTLDGLVSVPRSRRYLPMLAGMGADILVAALLALGAEALRSPDGSLPLASRIALALGFTTLLRVVWQFYFYLQTDLYYLVCTVLGCVQLHRTARQLLRNRVARLLRRPAWLVDETSWYPNDRRAASWYSWLLVIGYTSTVLVGLFAILPTAYLFLSGVLGRFVHPSTTAGLVDSTIFVALNTIQLVVVGSVAVRARRRRAARPRHVLA